jgi:glycosyltransferase involved in cell wall biosynthesis
LKAAVDAGCIVHAAAAAIEDDPTVAAKLELMGVTAYSIPIARAGMNPLRDLRAFIALLRLMRRVRPDMVLSYTIKPVVWATLAAWVARVPHRYAMITGLGYAFTGQPTGKRAFAQLMARLLYRCALAAAHRVFFQNPDDLALFKELGLVRSATSVTIVNGSGVDLVQYAPTPLPDGPPVFLMVARLLGDKGVREYAAAAAIVRRSYPSAVFHLVGGLDPNPDAIAQYEVDEWVRAGNIVWHGAQSDVRPFIALSHVYVLPSYREGTPRTVLEAMAMGRPIITTDAPGCRETVSHGFNGFLVGPRSIEELVNAMMQLIVSPELIPVMASRSLKIAQEKYDATQVSQQMLNIMGVLPSGAIGPQP